VSIDDASSVYLGTADTPLLREAGMTCTVSARVAKKKKGERRVSDPQTSPSHIFDMTSQTALIVEQRQQRDGQAKRRYIQGKSPVS
jgi:hypothetical protein